MFYTETPYLDMYRTTHLKFKPKPIVLHQRTCPDCGRTLVNVYYSAQLDRYICKKCIDKFMSEKGGAESGIDHLPKEPRLFLLQNSEGFSYFPEEKASIMPPVKAA